MHMSIKAQRLAGLVVGSALAAFGATISAQAQTGAEFYRGKTVSIVVGYAPGGGYDIYSRLLSRHLSAHIPGKPTVIVQNMPGAAGVVASNYVYSVAPKDGTVIAAVDQNIPMFNLLGGKGVQYDISKVAWLGTMASSNGVAMSWHTTGVNTLGDVKAHEVSIGTTGSNDDAYVYAKALNTLVGTQFRIIQGYSGTSSVNIAMENGEVQAMGRSSYYGFASQRPDWLRDKKVTILVQIGLQKQPELGDIPLFIDLVPGVEEKQIASLVSMPTSIGYSHWLSPDVPAERARILEAAYAETLSDPELLAEAKQQGIEIRPRTAAQIRELVKAAADTPAQVRAKAAAILGWN
ncbi:MAG: tripartite tricarboxylate transporter family receptor [Hyphomicrobiales bacterium]|nr:tripartite tricarboxylate transporter family receptor [Hyphomicrobiales bacterium]